MTTEPASSDRRRFASRMRDHVTPSIPGYHVLERIQAGPQSSTYRAVQLSMQREVALQVFAPRLAKIPGFTERFMQEARSAGAVHHPHVVACYDVGQADGVIFQALELINGQSLPQLLGEKFRVQVDSSTQRNSNVFLTPAHAISLMVDATRGLEGIHRAGLIHGDLRLSNIVVTTDEVVKLAGFGMARSREVMRDEESDLHDQAERGTLAPEQFMVGDRIDIRSDIYALGAILQVLLTGEKPFSRARANILAHAVGHGSVADSRVLHQGMNADLVAIITKAMATDPAERYATPGQLREDLERVQYDFVPLHAVRLSTGKIEREITADGVVERPLLSEPTPEATRSPTTTIAKNASFLVVPRAEEKKRGWRVGLGTACGFAAVAMSAYLWFNRSSSSVAAVAVAAPSPIVEPNETVTPLTLAQASAKKIPDPAFPGWSSANGTDQYGRWSEITLRGVALRLRFISGGRFIMGSLATDPTFRPDEQAVEVTLTHHFWVGESEVTQAQYFSLMGKNPSSFRGDRLPLENITWHESVIFIKRLNAYVPGLYARLPTEAEWEYACRAGTAELAAQSSQSSHPPMGWFNGPNVSMTQGVMGLPANAWGLYDMQGNVMEWCQDTYGSYPAQPSTDPLNLDGISRVVRGGSWAVDPVEGRPATRGKYLPVAHHAHLGLRIVVEDF